MVLQIMLNNISKVLVSVFLECQNRLEMEYRYWLKFGYWYNTTQFHVSFSEAEIRTLDNSADIFNSLSDIPRDLDDADCLIKVTLA